MSSFETVLKITGCAAVGAIAGVAAKEGGTLAATVSGAVAGAVAEAAGPVGGAVVGAAAGAASGSLPATFGLTLVGAATGAAGPDAAPAIGALAGALARKLTVAGGAPEPGSGGGSGAAAPEAAPEAAAVIAATVAGAAAGGEGEIPSRSNVKKLVENLKSYISKFGKPLLELIGYGSGCLRLVLECHTAQSFLQFHNNFESTKERLEKEFKKIGFNVDTIDIENKEQIKKQKEKISKSIKLENLGTIWFLFWFMAVELVVVIRRLSHFQKAIHLIRRTGWRRVFGVIDLKVDEKCQLLEFAYVVAPIHESRSFRELHFIIQETDVDQVSCCDKCNCQSGPLEKAIGTLQREIAGTPAVLVTHSNDGVEDFLRTIGVDISKLAHHFPGYEEIIDTQLIELGLQDQDDFGVKDLNFLLEKYKVDGFKAEQETIDLNKSPLCDKVKYIMRLFQCQKREIHSKVSYV